MQTTTATPLRTTGLVNWLQSRGYSWCDRRAIQGHVQIWQTLEGAYGLRPADVADAYAVLEADQPEVAWGDPAWGSSDDLDGLDLPPISGGSPEYTDQDHADHVSWLQELDGSYPADQGEDSRRWYATHPLAEFNALRTDSD